MTSVIRAVTSLTPNRYIVAVSGGVDSMVLLDALRQVPSVDLVVAHVNHGTRIDTPKDAQLVAAFCRSHNIRSYVKELHLSPGVSEDAARQARYAFLQQCRVSEHAKAIITAHHQDDTIETALFNVVRGTGWRGLAPFVGRDDVLRPFEDLPKAILKTYAQKHHVPWREDSTNQDQRYTRNYIRHTVLPFLEKNNPTWRSEFLRLIREQQQLRRTIDAAVNECTAEFFHLNTTSISSGRYAWCMLSDDIAYELLQLLCRRSFGHSIVRPLAESALIFARTARPHKVMPLNSGWRIRVTVREFIVESYSSMLK